MATPLRVLILEDNPYDAELALHALRRAGYDPIANRVETEQEYLKKLDPAPEIILADFTMPEFDSLRALELLQKRQLDIPFIIVSGTIGEERAVQVMQHGATDYIMKDRLGRLGQAVEQALARWRLKDEKAKAEQSAARLAAIVESSGDPIITQTLEGIITSWNHAAEHLYGYTAEEIIGTNISILFPCGRRRSDAPEDPQEILESLTKGEHIDAFETVRVRKDLRRIEVLLSISPIRDATGIVTGASAIAIDITRRKRVERFLNAEKAVTGILTESRTLAIAGPRVLETVAECLRWEVAVLWIIDRVANVLHRMHIWHAPWAKVSFVKELSQRAVLEPGIGIAGRAWSSGEPVWEPGMLIDSDPTEPSTMTREGLRCGFGIPMRQDAEMVGVIEFYNPEMREPDKLLVDTLDNIGCQISQFCERRRSEVALHTSESRFRQLADAMPQIVWTAGSDGMVDYFNDRWYKFAGTSRSVNPEQTWRATVHPDDLQHTQDMWFDSIRSGAPLQMEMRLREHFTGQYRWFLCRAIAARDPAGRVTRWHGTTTDIDDQKKSLEELRISEARFRNLVMALPAAVYTTDHAGLITLFNEHAVELWGRRPELGKDRWCGAWKLLRLDGSLLPIDQHPMAVTLREGRGIQGQELIVERPDGSRAPVLKHPQPLRGSKGEIVGAVNMVIDLTKMKQLEEQFRQVQKMEAVGQLAGGVAHDFNNLLTIINGYSDLLLESLPPTDPSRDSISEILKAGERSAGLTRQLLAFSRQQVMAPSVLDLNSVVTDTEKMLRRLIGEDVLLSTTLDPRALAVWADPGQIEQVLMNLAVNARDAMPRGGRLMIETRNVKLDEAYVQTHPDARKGQHVVLRVADTGSGMSPEVKARLFEPFFTTKGIGKGTGLGLATVYGIVKQSGGHLSVSSEVGVGTTFNVYLPNVEKTVGVSKTRPRLLTPSGGTETVLLVEDEAGVRALAIHVLAGYGYTMLEAADGDEAVRMAAEHTAPIHLLITDVVMPGTGGRVLAEKITDLHPDLRVLFVSGYTDDAVIRHGVLREEVHFLQKPFSPVALAFKVREVLDSSGLCKDEG